MGNSKTVRYVFSAVVLTIAILFLLLLATHNYVFGQTTPTALDPGVRVGGRLTGTPLATLTPAQVLYFRGRPQSLPVCRLGDWHRSRRAQFRARPRVQLEQFR
jgi:hypothetical protein